MKQDLQKIEQEVQEEVKEIEEKIQTSETFLLSAILALSGGFQDAYTYNVRDKVFSNAQTGNVVLMSQHMMMGEWGRALHYLFPVIAFAMGVLVAEQIGHAFGYYDYGEEVGMGAFYRSKDAVATYISGYVRMAFESGMLYTISERGEGYIAYKVPGQK